MQTIRNMDDKHLIAAAEFAFRQEWYDLAINTADKTQVMHDFALRYPTPYRDMMQSYAKENQLDEAWVYGLIRQESRFITQARSGVGAAGLMQVMPATARWIAKRIGFGQYHDNMIHQLNTNIQFGTYYLRHVLESMNGQPVMATAAYNAGPGRAKRWADNQPMEGAIYTETIPFNETRDYVKKVMGNAQYYARRLGTKIQTLTQRLGTIAGADSAKVEPTEPGGTEESNN
jgi:soluble lytic murein transglycosylase